MEINDDLMNFTQDWKRPQQTLVPSSAIDSNAHVSSNDEHQLIRSYPCLVCGATYSQKKCSRCRSASYCSASCQKQDYKSHKENCTLLKSLYAEKHELEQLLWSPLLTSEETNESVAVTCTAAKVGRFWIDVPVSNTNNQHADLPERTATTTTKYCVCLVKLVQILGRAESWRMKKTPYHPTKRRFTESSSNSRRAPFLLLNLAGNLLALDQAIDLAFDLLYLDRIDMRVRHCVPALLLECGQVQVAYDFIKFWLLPSTCFFLQDLVQGEFESEISDDSFTKEILHRPFLYLHNQDMMEDPKSWMDFQSVYTSVGMVFELSYIKIHLSQAFAENSPQYIKLQAEARLLLATVHSMNTHLIHPMALYKVPEKDDTATSPAGINELLNHMPPGLDLQYQWGNAGGGSLKEAAAIWQRDMVLWDNDARGSMKFLASFAIDLKFDRNNIPKVPADPERIYDLEKAKKLARELKDRNPNNVLSADQIMMHPEMAKLMLDQLNERKTPEKRYTDFD